MSSEVVYNESPFGLLDRVKARLIAGLQRETAERGDPSDIVISLIGVLASSRWYLMNNSEYLMESWNEVNGSDKVCDLVFSLVPDLKEEVIFNRYPVNTGTRENPTVDDPSRRWKKFCESIALLYEVMTTSSDSPATRFSGGDATTPQATGRGQTLIGDRSSANSSRFNLAATIEQNSWLCVLMVISLIPRETLMKSVKKAGGTNVGQRRETNTN